MPIYEYHCQDCNNSFETLVQAGHYDDAQCPSCTGVNIVREMSVFASRGAGTTLQPNGTGAAMMRGGGCCGGSCGCQLSVLPGRQRIDLASISLNVSPAMN